MEISCVTVSLVRNKNASVVAYASCVLDSKLRLNDMRIIHANSGLRVVYPRRPRLSSSGAQAVDAYGEPIYVQAMFPLDREFDNLISEKIINKYYEEQGRCESRDSREAS